MIKEGEAIAELVIEDPIRLWSQVPEQFAEDVQHWTARSAHHAGPSRRARSRARSPRINPAVETASRTFPGGNRRAQRARAAAAWWICEGIDHRRCRVQGGRGAHRIDRPVRGCHQALHRRERQGQIDQRYPDRNRRARMGRGDEQAVAREPLRSSPPAKHNSPKERPS